MGILSRGAFSDTDSNPSAALSVTPFTRHRALNLHLHGYLEPEENCHLGATRVNRFHWRWLARCGRRMRLGKRIIGAGIRAQNVVEAAFVRGDVVCGGRCGVFRT
jgi:hypothetical protein